jgi:hypothetical protein
MSNDEGFIKLYRKFFRHEFWTEKRTLSKAEAWIWILYQARYKSDPGKKIIGKKLIVWEQGEIAASLTFLRKAWSWKNNSNVNNFLKYLEREEMIYIDSSQGVNVISLVNHQKYNQQIYNDAAVPPLESIAKPEVSKTKPQTNTLNSQTQEILEYWNQCNGTRLKSTKERMPQVRARLKTFSIEEIKQAILNRANSTWVKENNQQSNTDPVLRSDKDLEMWLNRDPESKKTSKSATNQKLLTKKEAQNLADQRRIKFDESNFEAIKKGTQYMYHPLFMS